MASITTWHRLNPISRSSDFETAVAAEVHDPLWFLARQRQTGEMRGEDAGSPVFVRVAYRTAKLTEVVLTRADSPPVTLPLELGKPFEAQILAEPHAQDLATRAELGVAFFGLIDRAFGRGPAQPVRTAFLAAQEVALALVEPSPSAFDPVDDASRAFADLVVGKAVDGVLVYGFAKQGALPPSLATALDAGQAALVLDVFVAFSDFVDATYGPIGDTDPRGWNAQRLDYDVKVRFGTDSPMTLAVHPNEAGAVDWTSFDVETPDATPFATNVAASVAREIPTHVRFAGMPAPRNSR